MPLNLLSDPWIPVLRDGKLHIVRPHQIAEPGIEALAWPRADFNLACIELLIGLVSLADPPRDEEDWLARLKEPDAERLRKALELYAGFFSLSGDGPRFLQDLDAFENDAKPADIKPVEMLYMDSAGASAESKNADLMVKRGRVTSLSPAEAAMALFTMQAFAPGGGAGNRTSMRGAGPMTTLVRPLDDDGRRLWQLVFANVLVGSPVAIGDAERVLPWLRPTRTSQKGEIVTQSDSHPLEAFFGMPRRFRLVFRGDRVVGVVQKTHGTNYAMWEHPLTPYYRQKEDSLEWLPVHPKAGRLSYRNWLGVTMQSAADGKGTRRAAATVRAVNARSKCPDFELMVGGWAIAKMMKPVDFTLHIYAGFPGLDEDGEFRIRKLVDAANSASGALSKALSASTQINGTARDTVGETFFAETEAAFVASVRCVVDGEDTAVELAWHRTLREQAVRMYDRRALSGLSDHDISRIEKRVNARRDLLATLAKQVRTAMDLPIPGGKEKQA